MLHHNALRQLTRDHRLHHEAEADAERLALQIRGGRDRRSRRLPLAGELERLREARAQAATVVVTVLPRR